MDPDVVFAGAVNREIANDDVGRPIQVQAATGHDDVTHADHRLVVANVRAHSGKSERVRDDDRVCRVDIGIRLEFGFAADINGGAGSAASDGAAIVAKTDGAEIRRRIGVDDKHGKTAVRGAKVVGDEN